MRILLFVFISISAFGQYPWSNIDFKAIARAESRGEYIPSQGKSLPELSADILIPASAWYVDTDRSRSDAFVVAAKPGDRLIMMGDRKEIEFHDLIGTADKPIIITGISKILITAANAGGRVVQFINCQYVRLTGDPDGTGAVNIFINGGGQAVDFRDLSRHVEADHLDITTGYSGINAKTDPTCDPKTWRGAFILDGVYLHHNRISTKTGEGFYVGESHYYTVGAIQGGPCSSGATTAEEHEVRNVLIEDNEITTSGADGIQVGSCPSGTCTIRRNKVYKYGMANGHGQTAGIIVNPGTVADVYDNIVDTGAGFAIQSQGPGGTKIHDNLILNPGLGGVMTVNYAIKGFTTTATDQIYNNTIVNAKGSALEYYNTITFKNNIYELSPGAVAFKKGGGAGVLTESGNKQLSGISGQLDSSYAPLPGVIPPGVGYKPLPVIVRETGSAELVITNGVEEWFLVMPSGKRKKLD